MARWTRTDPAPGVREALIAKLSTHERRTFDPRWVLVPKDQWPSPMPPYVDHFADMYDDLVAGKAVNVAAWHLRRIVDFPRDWHSVHVDGTISRADYDRGAPEPH